MSEMCYTFEWSIGLEVEKNQIYEQGDAACALYFWRSIHYTRSRLFFSRVNVGGAGGATDTFTLSTRRIKLDVNDLQRFGFISPAF